MSQCKVPVTVLTNEAASELGMGNKGNVALALSFDEQGNVNVFITNETTLVPSTQFPIDISEKKRILNLQAISSVRYDGSPTITTMCVPSPGGGPPTYITVYK